MIYPDISLETWVRKYELDVIEGTCNECGSSMRTTIPWISKGYAGLVSPACPCGKSRHNASVSVTTSPETHAEWVNVLTGTLEEEPL